MAMDLLDEESHRLLLWTVRLHEVGGTPTRKQLRRLSEPRRPAGLAVVTGLSGRHTEFAEGAISSLLRRGLLESVGDDKVQPTDLGCMVVNALGLHPEESPLFEVIDADLRSSDPLAFARIVGRIAALDRPMVVDPYCRREQLEYLISHTTVTRVLVSDRLSEAELHDLAQALTTVSNRETKLRIRVAPADAIHDRHVINGDRVLHVAAAPNGQGAGTTVVSEPVDLGPEVRRYYRSVWKRARKVATYRPSRVDELVA